MITTTLNKIKACEPCGPGWEKLLTSLGKTGPDDEPLNLLHILKSNGVNDCLWAFRCTEGNDRIYRHMAADFAESVLYIFEDKYPNDNRPRLAIDAARDFADGKIDAAAKDAARAAAGDAARAADAAAWSAARSAWAAWAAAMDAAGDAAWAAGDAWAAGAAARSAERQKQYDILFKYLTA